MSQSLVQGASDTVRRDEKEDSWTESQENDPKTKAEETDKGDDDDDDEEEEEESGYEEYEDEEEEGEEESTSSVVLQPAAEAGALTLKPPDQVCFVFCVYEVCLFGECFCV